MNLKQTPAGAANDEDLLRLLLIWVIIFREGHSELGVPPWDVTCLMRIQSFNCILPFCMLMGVPLSFFVWQQSKQYSFRYFPVEEIFLSYCRTWGENNDIWRIPRLKRTWSSLPQGKPQWSRKHFGVKSWEPNIVFNSCQSQISSNVQSVATGAEAYWTS